MTRKLNLFALLPVMVVQACWAGDPNYIKPLKEYLGEMDREPIDIHNTPFHAVSAKATVNKATWKADRMTKDRISTISARSGNDGSDDPGEVNIASPHIEGGNHGKVIVIVERGAIKGNITTIQK